MGTLDAIACLAHGSSNRWLLHLLRALQARIATASARRAVAASPRPAIITTPAPAAAAAPEGITIPTHLTTAAAQAAATRAGGSTGAAAALVTRSLLGCVASCAGHARDLPLFLEPGHADPLLLWLADFTGLFRSFAGISRAGAAVTTTLGLLLVGGVLLLEPLTGAMWERNNSGVSVCAAVLSDSLPMQNEDNMLALCLASCSGSFLMRAPECLLAWCCSDVARRNCLAA